MLITSVLLEQPQEGQDPGPSQVPPIPDRLPRQRGYLGFGVELARHSKTTLLSRPLVKQELNLTTSQEARLKEIDDDLSRRDEPIQQENQRRFEDYMKSLRERGQQADPQVLAAMADQTGARREPLLKEADTAKLKVLDKHQLTRLNEVQLQAEGPMALTRPEIQQQLNLDRGQIEAIGEIIAEGREEMIRVSALPADLMTRNSGPATQDERRTFRASSSYKAEVEKSRAAALKARQQIVQKINRLLTKRQRETLNKMLGEPFDLQKLGVSTLPSGADVKNSTPPAAPGPAEKTKTRERQSPNRLSR